MKCNKCKRKMSYDYDIDKKYWLKANGKEGGVLCAHCCLESLGLKIWNITPQNDTIL